MTGTSSPDARSAILIPVPEAEAAVGPWRQRFDPVASAGVPAHITLLVPWLELRRITPAVVSSLEEALGDTKAFDFSLTRAEWFGRRVLWLAPEPADTFKLLTEQLSERFSTPPWEDEFDEVVPHLTVARATDGEELAAVKDALQPFLPMSCRAEEVWVMVGDGARWSVHTRVALR
jgi:2'-5' RNA ligase